MLLNIKEIIARGTTYDLYHTVTENADDSEEVILDFNGVREIQDDDSEHIMTACLKLKQEGSVVTLKNMSLPVRNRFLLSAIDYAGDEVIL